MTWYSVVIALATGGIVAKMLPNDCITLAWRHLRGPSAPRPAPVEIEGDAG